MIDTQGYISIHPSHTTVYNCIVVSILSRNLVVKELAPEEVAYASSSNWFQFKVFVFAAILAVQ